MNSISVTSPNTATTVGQGGRILRTTDGGTNWLLQSSSTGQNLYGVDFVDANIGTAVGQDGTIIHTTDGGTNWAAQTSGAIDGTLFSVSFLDLNNGIAVGYENTGILIVRTTNGGQEWTKISNSIVEDLYSVQYINSQVATAAGNIGIIYRSTDSGLSWARQDSGRSYGLHSVSFTNENIGTAVGENGTIFRTTNGGVTFINDQNNYSVPKDFALYQNYPNPFNPNTTISYSINSKQFVKLKLFDMLGNEIATLVNQEKPAGTYKLTWNASNLPSGVYFYRIQAGSFVETKKMIFLK
jgi:photosystem II stability/assembly factor-like uncharacterized protein